MVVRFRGFESRYWRGTSSDFLLQDPEVVRSTKHGAGKIDFQIALYSRVYAIIPWITCHWNHWHLKVFQHLYKSSAFWCAAVLLQKLCSLFSQQLSCRLRHIMIPVRVSSAVQDKFHKGISSLHRPWDSPIALVNVWTESCLSIRLSSASRRPVNLIPKDLPKDAGTVEMPHRKTHLSYTFSDVPDVKVAKWPETKPHWTKIHCWHRLPQQLATLLNHCSQTQQSQHCKHPENAWNHCDWGAAHRWEHVQIAPLNRMPWPSQFWV